MKKFILVAGLPACGKTFVAERLAKNINNCVYLDKDDLGNLLRQACVLNEQVLDYDGTFYQNNLRSVEYDTILSIALSALRFNDIVILNAPFLKEMRDFVYMQNLKEKVNSLGAELTLIWVVAPDSVMYERMKKRNSPRDKLKLENWSEYIKSIDYSPPMELVEKELVNALLVFDTKNEQTTENNLQKAIYLINM